MSYDFVGHTVGHTVGDFVGCVGHTADRFVPRCHLRIRDDAPGSQLSSVQFRAILFPYKTNKEM